MKFTIIKQFDNSFKLAFDSDYEKLKKIKPMELLECEIKKPRNYKFHKKFFALINMVFQNQERYSNIDDLRQDLTIEAGFFTIREDMQGNAIKKANSISFANMEENDFNEYYNKVLDCIVLHFNFDKQLIIDNVEQYF